MLFPKKVKHRKWQKGRKGMKGKGRESRGYTLSFGAYGLKAMASYWLTARQIEAARRAMTRYVQRGGKIWIRVFPDKPVTKKSAEMPMGGGKGSPEYYVAPVKPGRILFEMDGVSEAMAKEAMRRAAHKLPIKTKFIAR